MAAAWQRATAPLRDVNVAGAPAVGGEGVEKWLERGSEPAARSGQREEVGRPAPDGGADLHEQVIAQQQQQLAACRCIGKRGGLRAMRCAASRHPEN